MPRLHETPIGQKFFNLQVPQLLKAVLDLIKTIQDHTKALNENTAALARYTSTVNGDSHDVLTVHGNLAHE